MKSEQHRLEVKKQLADDKHKDRKDVKSPLNNKEAPKKHEKHNLQVKIEPIKTKPVKEAVREPSSPIYSRDQNHGKADHSPTKKFFKLHEPDKPLVIAYIKQQISKTECTLIVKIPSQLEQDVEFSFDFTKDTPEGTAEDLIGFLKVPHAFIKHVAQQIRTATEKLEREHAQEQLRVQFLTL